MFTCVILCRAVSSGVRQTPVNSACHGAGKRFYRAAVCTKLGQPLEIKDVPLPDKVPEGKVSA